MQSLDHEGKRLEQIHFTLQIRLLFRLILSLNRQMLDSVLRLWEDFA
jgi:hypothetical protein